MPDVALDLNKLVGTYKKIRDRRAEIKKAFSEEDTTLKEQLGVISAALLAHCKETGQEGGRTIEGTFTRSVKTNYWVNDWEEMHKFVMENNLPELLEKRIAQGNMRKWLEDNPDAHPKGLQINSEYTMSVRKSA